MKRIAITLITIAFCLALSSFTLSAQKKDICGITNTSFVVGERVTYTVSYTWLMLWTDVGEVNFEVKSDKKFGRDALHLHCTGKSYPFYDWFFKVRDLYESWVDPVTLEPIYFNRAINEGGYKKENEYTFKKKSNQIYARIKRRDKPSTYDTLNVPSCTYDVVTAIYISRNLDFSKAEIGKVIPVSVALDREVYNVGYKFLGRETKNISGLGKFKCLKFQVDLVAGDVFSGEQKLMVWVTDDRNKIPISIESPIKVGSIKVRVIDWHGLRHPLTSKVK